MKLQSIELSSPVSGICRQWAIWGREGVGMAPLIYLQRPKWIKNDAAWEEIVKSIQLTLPNGMEVS